MNASAAPFLDLSRVIRGLRVAVAAWGGRGWLQVALVLLVHRRLGQICDRMERMVARFQAGRLWRPLCRMLAIETSVLQPGVEVVAPVAVVKVKRVCTPRVKVDWGRIPMPRGVLAAVRRRGGGERGMSAGASYWLRYRIIRSVWACGGLKPTTRTHNE